VGHDASAQPAPAGEPTPEPASFDSPLE